VKIYLAAKFEQKRKMRGIRAFLQNDGHEITSRWIDVEHEEDKSHTVTDAHRIEYAQMDVADVLKADVLVAFSQPRVEPAIGGGRHVEFGIALHAGKKIIVVGPKGEHIFHYWPGIMFADDLDGLAHLLWGMK
jgi:nucleoside 2-deoxyribosyltransferase